ncbi:general secretion pathway protein GspK, partial [Sandarakinorhabdus rubra]|uniref:general secretion pathway protein GspK n=1 Tax=Sandarakinorhabdus rubra TaxID=2672568 RepID=UPI0013D9B750
SARPAGGWASVTDFWGQPLLAGRTMAADVLRQPDLTDRFITFRIAVGGNSLPFVETGLIAAGAGERPARLLLRRWGGAE